MTEGRKKYVVLAIERADEGVTLVISDEDGNVSVAEGILNVAFM